MVAIARAVDMDCKVLILDEPTSSLDDKEVEMLFSLMRDLKARGVGIIFVTHFLEQVYAVSDRITVLRNGELVGEYEVENLPQVELVAKMIGKELQGLSELERDDAADVSSGTPVYEASSLASTTGIAPFDFAIRKGEVNGFTGLLGSGRNESVCAIFGADRVSGGTVSMDGQRVKIGKPKQAMKHGIGYLPEDRKDDGIIADLSVRENIILALQLMKGFFRLFSQAEQEAFADEYIKALEIKTASSDTPIKSLSGGRFKVSGSVLGAYAIQALTTTLYAMKVPSTDVKAHKAIVIILIVVISSPFVKQAITRLWAKNQARISEKKEVAT